MGLTLDLKNIGDRQQLISKIPKINVKYKIHRNPRGYQKRAKKFMLWLMKQKILPKIHAPPVKLKYVQ